MYDILQLNDMLVPELQDIAEHLNIPNAKKLNKQDLVYKILDSQALENSEKPAAPAEKPRRKRTMKTAVDTLPSVNEIQEELNDPQPGNSTAQDTVSEEPVKRRKRKSGSTGTRNIR